MKEAVKVVNEAWLAREHLGLVSRKLSATEKELILVQIAGYELRV